MNPVVVIGMVALVTLGLYGMQAGIMQQAELGEIQRDMMARSAAMGYASGAMDGVIEGGRHLLVTNHGAHPAELIQIRTHQNGDLSRVWAVSFDIPPYKTLNITRHATPLPLQLVGGFGDARKLNYTFVGVTAQGAVFPIELHDDNDLEKRSPHGSYGAVSVMRLDGGGGNATGVDPLYDFHFGDSRYVCWHDYPKYGRAYFIYYAIYDAPFQTHTHLTEPPDRKGVRDSGWSYLLHMETDSPAGSWKECPAYPGLPDDTKHHPLDVFLAEPYVKADKKYDYVDVVFARLVVGADYAVEATYAEDGALEAPADGRMLVRVEAPINGLVTARYSFGGTLACHDKDATTWLSGDVPKFPCSCMDAGNSAVKAKLDEWTDSVPPPSFSVSANVSQNGVVRDTLHAHAATPLKMSDVHLGLYKTGHVKTNPNCLYGLDAVTDMTWKYDAGLDGWKQLDVNAGDGVGVAISVELKYDEVPSYTAGSLAGSHTFLDVGDAIVTTGWLSGGD